MLLENADYFVRLVPFPPGAIDGCVTPNDDGTFSVYLDSNVSREKQLKALGHELNHIELDHFYEDKPQEQMEREADTGVKESGAPGSSLPTVIEKPKQDWLSSWQRCMEWARQMQAKYGDNPPPEDYPYFAAG